MSLPRSTTQLVSLDAASIEVIPVGKVPPPPISNFAILIPICLYGAAAACAAWAICTSSTGAKITCPPAPDFSRVWQYGSRSWCFMVLGTELANNTAQYVAGTIDETEYNTRNGAAQARFALCILGIGKGGLNAGTGA